MKQLLSTLSLLLLAACARSEDASLVQPDSREGYNRIDPVGAPEANDQGPAIGQWRAALQDDAQALEFGPMGTEPLFSLLCTPARGVTLQRHGEVPAGPLPAMQVSVGSYAEQLPVTAGGGTVPMLRAEVAAGSRLLTALGTSAGPIHVRVADAAVTMPPSPLVADYLGSCARGETAVLPGNSAAPAPEPAANQAGPAANQAAPANSAAPTG